MTIKLKELNTVEDFEALERDDIVAVEWLTSGAFLTREVLNVTNGRIFFQVGTFNYTDNLDSATVTLISSDVNGSK